MSRNSNKARYDQIKYWMSDFKSTDKESPAKKYRQNKSKADYYKNQGAR